MSNSYSISTDKSKLDIDCIYEYLAHRSYWAGGRSRETVQKSIQSSLCFGLYKDGQQVGFARVITDYAVFAWLLDVFVLEAYQKQGGGKALLEAIKTYPDLDNVKRWMLATKDAHGLYEQYGFRKLKDPDAFMEFINVHHH